MTHQTMNRKISGSGQTPNTDVFRPAVKLYVGTGPEDVQPVLVPVEHPAGNAGTLVIRPESPDYDLVIEAIRRNHVAARASRAERQSHVRIEWVWSLPEPLRVAILAIVDDVEGSWRSHVSSSLSDMLFGWLQERLGDVCEEREYEHDEMVAALREPTTMAAALLRLSDELELGVRDWLTEHFAAALQAAAE
jgi:hypothetical protein